LKNNLVVEGKRTINLSQYIKNRIWFYKLK
jgi:hypothetical protein